MASSCIDVHRRWPFIGVVLAGALIGVRTAAAQEDRSVISAPPPIDGTPSALCSCDPQWTIQIEPTLWWTSPSGKLKLPASGAVAGDSVRVERLNLDSPQFSPAGAATIRAGDFRFMFSGAAYSRDVDTVADSSFTLGDVAVAPGDNLVNSFDFSTFQLDVGYRILSIDYKARSSAPTECADIVLRLFAVAGLRLTEVEFGIHRLPSPGGGGGAAEQTQQLFVEPLIGVRAELDFFRDFSVDVQLSGGGLPFPEHSAYSFEIIHGVTWRPTPSVGIQLGWRQVLYSLADGKDAGEFMYGGAMAGAFVELVIRF